MKKFKTIYNYKQNDGVKNITPSMTQQQFKDECDINSIMSKYLKTGVLADPLDKRGTPKFGEYAEIGDYMDHMNKVVEAREMFEALPATIRKRFNNNPADLIEFVMDDGNYNEAVKLGILEKKIEKVKIEESVNSVETESSVSVTDGNNISLT